MGVLTDYFAANGDELDHMSVDRGPFPDTTAAAAKPKKSGGGLFGLFRSKPEPAPVVEAPTVAEAPPLPAFSSKGIDAPRIALLDSLLTGVAFADEDLDGSIVKAGGDEGPWISALRPEFRDAIARIDDGAAADLAARWAADTDWMGETDAESVAALREFIGELRGLANTAIESGRNLYVWVCL